jgi:hypothetical protein
MRLVFQNRTPLFQIGRLLGFAARNDKPVPDLPWDRRRIVVHRRPDHSQRDQGHAADVVADMPPPRILHDVILIIVERG